MKISGDKMKKTLSICSFVLLTALSGMGQAQVSETQVLEASDGASKDYFGRSVSISGDYAVIGADWDDDLGSSSGSAYIFSEDSDGNWSQSAKLTADDGDSSDYFGKSVSISGDTVIIGASQDEDEGIAAGAAYIFDADASAVWSQTKKLTASDASPLDYFGISTAISGDLAIVGAYGANDASKSASYPGAAYVFSRDGDGTWTEADKLIASDGANHDSFGYSVAIDTGVAIVGAYEDDDSGDSSGSAYIYSQNVDGTWSEADILQASDGEAYDYFGKSVSIWGDVAVVGAAGDDDEGTSAGAAYVFTKNADDTWSQAQKLTASDGTNWDAFGSSVYISDSAIAIGALAEDSSSTSRGAVYLFSKNNDGEWYEVLKLTASDGAVYDRFGASVAFSDNTVLVGAYTAEVGSGSDVGKAYIFSPSDVDGDEYLNFDLEGNKFDCNDEDPFISPADWVEEIYDGVDNDCDGEIDELTGYYDDDGDGYSEEDGSGDVYGISTETGGDCNDWDASVSPDATEVCGDSVDNNCDGTVDEGCSRSLLPAKKKPGIIPVFKKGL